MSNYNKYKYQQKGGSKQGTAGGESQRPDSAAGPNANAQGAGSQKYMPKNRPQY